MNPDWRAVGTCGCPDGRRLARFHGPARPRRDRNQSADRLFSGCDAVARCAGRCRITPLQGADRRDQRCRGRSQPGAGKDVARRLRYHNIAISIDDVGAEWPSFLGLRDFPFVELRVDRQFVAGCGDDRSKQTTCRRIIELADGMGARTVTRAWRPGRFSRRAQARVPSRPGPSVCTTDDGTTIRANRAGPSMDGAEVTQTGKARRGGRNENALRAQQRTTARPATPFAVAQRWA